MILDYDDQTNEISPVLQSLLVCPVDHADLSWSPGLLRCVRCSRTYPIIERIPNMLVDEEPEPLPMK